MNEEENMRAQTLGNELAKETIRQLNELPAREIGLSSAASSLLAAGYAIVSKLAGPTYADRWMVIVLTTVKEALKEVGFDVTFSFVRKPE